MHSNRDYAFVNFVEIFVDMAFDVDVKNILKYEILSVGAGPVRFQLAASVSVWQRVVNHQPGFRSRDV